MPSVIAPLRGEKVVSDGFIPLPRFMQWIEEISLCVRPRSVQNLSTDYALLGSDAGITCTSETTQSITLPDATKIKGQEYYVQNASSAGIVTLTCFGTQQIAGSDAIVIPASIPYSSPFLKSDGTNWVLLGFLPESAQIIINNWIDDTGDFLVDDTGDSIILYA